MRSFLPEDRASMTIFEGVSPELHATGTRLDTISDSSECEERKPDFHFVTRDSCDYDHAEY
jgi:hypothetical protein